MMLNEQKMKLSFSKVSENYLNESVNFNSSNENINFCNNIKLTKRELECVEWLARGKTAEEISIILSLSKRTIEMFIAKARKKFNCTKSTELIYKFITYKSKLNENKLP